MKPGNRVIEGERLMIEDYGTLSEEELLEEIIQELEEETEIDASNLEFHFEEGKLMIHGGLAKREDLEYLVGVLENHVEPSDYKLDIGLLSGENPTAPGVTFTDQQGPPTNEGEEGFREESLDKVDEDEDEMDFVDEEGIEEDEKW